MDQEDVIAFLSNSASYDAVAGPVERHETHGAIVFLAGDYAYKLKRAVRFLYMDYSTPALRRTACDMEMAVNRRTAPALYLRVKAIVRDAQGQLHFGESEDPAAVDWVVMMRRFAQSSLLENMRKAGELTADIMQKLAEKIAAFHAAAERVDKFGGAEGIRRVIAENVQVLSSFRDAPFPGERIAAYDRLANRVLRTMSGKLEERRASGFVRRCHGDLHLNNVCMIDGAPMLFDAIEFNEEFSCIDVFYDLAFLLMDLEHNREGALANILLNGYLEQTGDLDGLAVLPLFLSCRAAVRAHVQAAQAAITGERDVGAGECAQSYLEDAIRFLQPVPLRLIVLGGVSGTGKSTVARALAPLIGCAPGAVILRSDVFRKKLWGVAKDVVLPAKAYEAGSTRQVYELLCRHAAEVLATGHSVIIDAVCGTEEERHSIAAIGKAPGIVCNAFWLNAPLEILERRVADRRNDASDATVDILHRQRAMISPPTGWLAIDASGTPEQTLKYVRAALKL